MKLHHLYEQTGNSSVNGVLNIIANVYSGTSRITNPEYCHNVTAQAIKDNTASPTDYILLVGSGSNVAHSLIVNTDGNVVADSGADHNKGITGNVVNYYVSQLNRIESYTIIQSILVSRFKEMFSLS